MSRHMPSEAPLVQPFFPRLVRLSGKQNRFQFRWSSQPPGVMPGLVPGIHAAWPVPSLTNCCGSTAWLAGTSPAMTSKGCEFRRFSRSADAFLFPRDSRAFFGEGGVRSACLDFLWLREHSRSNLSDLSGRIYAETEVAALSSFPLHRVAIGSCEAAPYPLHVLFKKSDSTIPGAGLMFPIPILLAEEREPNKASLASQPNMEGQHFSRVAMRSSVAQIDQQPLNRVTFETSRCLDVDALCPNRRDPFCEMNTPRLAADHHLLEPFYDVTGNHVCICFDLRFWNANALHNPAQQRSENCVSLSYIELCCRRRLKYLPKTVNDSPFHMIVANFGHAATPSACLDASALSAKALCARTRLPSSNLGALAKAKLNTRTSMSSRSIPTQPVRAMPRQRADLVLVERGLFESRAKAQAAIAAGLVKIDGRALRKPSELVAPQARIEAAPAHPYVSRGGVKLAHGLAAFGIDPKGKICLDIGASTGGFADVLLRRSARQITCVDVGHGQLHPKIAARPEVISMEGTDARTLAAAMFSEPPQLVVCDVSFISLKLVLPPVLALAAAKAALVALIKPQFEAGPGEVKKGLLRDAARRGEICRDTVRFVEALGWRVVGLVDSPITGRDGNREFLLGAEVRR